jgi:hypothetical protein
MFRNTTLAAAACLLITSVTPTRANLVTDPGFESCSQQVTTPPGWTATGIAECGSTPHSGVFDAQFSGVAATLSQSIPTAGDTYDFSFWLRSVNASVGTVFTASFGADQVLNLTSSGVAFPYTFENFAVTATATTTTVQFQKTGGLGGFLALDDVSVTPAIPEPGSLAVLAAALCGLAAIRRRAVRSFEPGIKR